VFLFGDSGYLVRGLPGLLTRPLFSFFFLCLFVWV
jgi:hypothetical protein